MPRHEVALYSCATAISQRVRAVFYISYTFSTTVVSVLSPFGGVSTIPSASIAIKLSSNAFLLSSLRCERSTATSSPNLAAISSNVRPTSHIVSDECEAMKACGASSAIACCFRSPFVSGRKKYSSGTQIAGTRMNTRSGIKVSKLF